MSHSAVGSLVGKRMDWCDTQTLPLVRLSKLVIVGGLPTSCQMRRLALNEQLFVPFIAVTRGFQTSYMDASMSTKTPLDLDEHSMSSSLSPREF
jgi:hypothetical protein